MQVAPDSNILVLKNCPLDTTYDHTIYFDSESSQITYFNTLVKYNFTNYTYQRTTLGTIRVQQVADNLYDCNYLCFQNRNFGNKWFYAFIKSITYLNNETSEIEWEIDVMQTWMFDYELEMSFVEREHSSSDTIGANTLPENVPLGPYIENNVDSIPYINTSTAGTIVVLTAFNNDEELTPATGTMVSNVYSGLNCIVFNNAVEANSFLDKVTEENKIEGIVGVYQCPWNPLAEGDLTNTSVSVPKYLGAINGYAPKNKKLLTYPYNFLKVTTNETESEFAYENFSSSTCGFNVLKGIYPEVAVTLVPRNYLSSIGELRFDQRLTVTGFPQCSYTSDVFKAYMAYNATSLPTKMITNIASGLIGVISSVAGGSSGVALQQGMSTAFDTANTIAGLKDMTTRPREAHGTQTSAVDYAFGAMAIYGRHMSIKAEYARVIDDYFTMYGYSTMRVKKPNRNVRPHWCYTKTIGANITGSVPCDDMTKIIGIYDKGITFWKNGNEIGNYSLDNSP